ncbi:maleylpyruvate isomerase family mycothiol-dependent enzyme [Kitasatospora sp. NPDC096128]|uniref:maleylpyruvate isomerase family mycothiol-dependent enzyme n=1 Tax=Kitasatospora sp. NPDC096128 TaxID=3155547 RepID=UPI00332FD51B
MTQTPSFEDLLALIEERSAALGEAVAGTPDPDVPVPGCPDWSLRQLVEHLTEVQHFWSVAVTAGSGAEPPADSAPPARLTEATGALVAALRKSGPDTGCWAWWEPSAAPRTAAAVARHQVHEAAVHAFDAQLAVGGPQPVPAAVAIDGIAEFIAVTHGSSGAWPHPAARVGLHAAEGPSWVLELGHRGARPVDNGATTDAALHAPASDLLLALYARLPGESLRVEGDRALLRRFLDWPSLD